MIILLKIWIKLMVNIQFRLTFFFWHCLYFFYIHIFKFIDLNIRVHELLRIRSSVLKELRSLERNRTSIIQELTEHNNELEKLKSTIGKKSSELERIQMHIKQAVVAQKEAKVLVGSMIEPPLNLLPKQAQEKISIENGKWI